MSEPVKTAPFSTEYKGPVRDYIRSNTMVTPPGDKAKLDFGLGGLNKAFRTISFNSPLVGAGITGLGLGALGYYAGPYLAHMVQRAASPKFGKGGNSAPRINVSQARQDWAVGLGGAGLLAVILANISLNAPGYGLFKYPALRKKSSGNVWNDMTLGQGMQLIQNTPNLSDEARTQSMILLDSFNQPPSTRITGNDLVGQAIATGQSAAVGAGIGYMTAKLLGLNNPSSTAILGAVSNVLGPRAALIGSTVFGH